MYRDKDGDGFLDLEEVIYIFLHIKYIFYLLKCNHIIYLLKCDQFLFN